MAIADKRPQIETSTEGDDFDADPDAAGVLVDDITELRWIAEGRLPTDVEAWFTRGGTTGVIEKRCDTHRMDGRCNQGVNFGFARHRSSRSCRRSASTSYWAPVSPVASTCGGGGVLPKASPTSVGRCRGSTSARS